MHDWKIVTNLAVNDNGPDQIRAEYFKATEDNRFVEFKDADHKVVYMVASDHLVSVTRV